MTASTTGATSSTSRLATFLRFPVMPPPARPLMWTVAMQALGFGTLVALGAIYFTRTLGFSVLQVGGGMSLAAMVGLVAGIPSGYLADRYGPRNLLIGLLMLQAMAVLGFLAVSNWASLLLCMAAYQFVDRAASAVRGALVARLVPGTEQTLVRSYLRSISNVGFSAGALLVGGVLYLDQLVVYQLAFTIAALGYVGASLSLRSCAKVEAVPKAELSRLGAVLRDGRFVLFAALNMVMSFQYAVLEFGMPIWVAMHTDAPKWLVSALFLLNTLTVVLLQVPLGRSADTLRGAAKATLLSGVLLLGSCLAFGVAPEVAGWVTVVSLVTAGMLHALGEMLQTAGAWTLAHEMSSPNLHGQYQGLFSTSISAGLLLGTSAVALAVEARLAGWAVLAALFFCASLATAMLVRGRSDFSVSPHN